MVSNEYLLYQMGGIKQFHIGLYHSSVADIPIMFGRTYITYEQNRFFKYEQVVNCIETMKLETQRSPAESFDEAEKASLEVIASTKTIIDSVSGMIGKLPKRISSKEA